MYNSEVKERFLSQYISNGSKGIDGRFQLLEESEQIVGKDIAEMSVSESILAINSLELVDMASVESTLSTIKSYVKWCSDNAVFSGGAGGVLNVTLDDIDPSNAMARIFFRDEHDFLYSMRKVREFDELQNDVIALIFAWLGLSFDEALDIHEDGVNFDERKIYARDGSILVPWFSDEFAEVLMLYKRTKSATRQNATTTYEVIKDLSYDGFIKRVCSVNSDKLGTMVPARQLTSAVNKLNQKYVDLGYAPRFTAKNAMRCGGLNRLFSLEQSGVSIDDKQNSAIVEETYGSKQYRKIRWQYKYYKKAFNL